MNTFTTGWRAYQLLWWDMKRTDPFKWADPWFEELTPTHKLSYLYLCDACDCAGIWKVSLKQLHFHTGCDEMDWRELLEVAGEDRIHKLNGGSAVWLVKYIPFQYPGGWGKANNVCLGIARRLQAALAPIDKLPSPYDHVFGKLTQSVIDKKIEVLGNP